MTLDDLDINGKNVLVRVDFNVPISKEGKVEDSTRLHAAIATIHNIHDYGGAAVLMSHLGRPDGKRVEKYSLQPVAEELQLILGTKVGFATDCIGPDVQRMVHDLNPGDVLLLENVRFHPGEDDNDPAFAAELAKMGDVYVNDAFGTAHRKHASTYSVPKHFPGQAAAGRLMMREMRMLSRTLLHPARPFVGIIGGAKVSTKVKTIRRLIGKVDKLIIGGGMSYTLIKAKGGKIGASLLEENMIDEAKKILDQPDAEKLMIPQDSVAAIDLNGSGDTKVFPSDDIPDGWRGLDIGPQACDDFEEVIKSAGTVFWNGPMGLFELEPFSIGTRRVAHALVDFTAHGGVSVVGGGDSIAALNRFALTGSITHISTGGGALLEFLEGNPLPAIEALSDAEEL